MKHLKPLVALAAAMLVNHAAADRSVDEVRAFDGGLVEVNNVAGDVDVELWDRDELRVSGTLWEGVEELEIDVDGDRARIRVHVDNHDHDIERSDLLVQVPRGSELEVSGMSSDIRVRGEAGRQRLRTMSGDIETRAGDGRVDAETMSGDVDIVGDGRVTRVRGASMSGDVTFRGVHGDIEAGSVSGNVRVDDTTVDRAELSTTSGRVNFEGRLAAGAVLDIEVTSGDTTIDLVGEVDARFEIETFSGRIRNEFGPRPERTSEYSSGEELRFTQGDGKATVEVSTFSGSVRLRRR